MFENALHRPSGATLQVLLLTVAWNSFVSTDINQVQKLQNRAAGIIADNSSDAQIGYLSMNLDGTGKTVGDFVDN